MKIKVIRIEKFYTPNYVAPGTMFEELLEFVRRRVDAGVQVLEVGTTKGVYQSKFRKWGWEVKGIKGS